VGRGPLSPRYGRSTACRAARFPPPVGSFLAFSATFRRGVPPHGLGIDEIASGAPPCSRPGAADLTRPQPAFIFEPSLSPSLLFSACIY
jgi:hypothetical protein